MVNSFKEFIELESKKEYYIKQIQTLDSRLKGMGKIISKKDLEINSLKKGNATLQKKLLNKD